MNLDPTRLRRFAVCVAAGSVVVSCGGGDLRPSVASTVLDNSVSAPVVTPIDFDDTVPASVPPDQGLVDAVAQAYSLITTAVPPDGEALRADGSGCLFLDADDLLDVTNRLPALSSLGFNIGAPFDERDAFYGSNGVECYFELEGSESAGQIGLTFTDIVAGPTDALKWVLEYEGSNVETVTVESSAQGVGFDAICWQGDPSLETPYSCSAVGQVGEVEIAITTNLASGGLAAPDMVALYEQLASSATTALAGVTSVDQLNIQSDE